MHPSCLHCLSLIIVRLLSAFGTVGMVLQFLASGTVGMLICCETGPPQQQQQQQQPPPYSSGPGGAPQRPPPGYSQHQQPPGGGGPSGQVPHASCSSLLAVSTDRNAIVFITPLHVSGCHAVVLELGYMLSDQVGVWPT